MKNIIVITIIGTTLLTLISCKKDYLTKEELKEELANNTDDNNLPNWEIFETANTYNYKDSVSSFIYFLNIGETISVDYFPCNYSLENNYKYLVIDADTTGKSSNYSNLMQPQNNWKYLHKLFSSQRYFDVIEIIRLNNGGAIFYSKALNEFINTDRI